MRIFVQRVSRATVTVNGETLGAIDKGLMALVGYGEGDSEAGLGPMVDKLINLRVFPDPRGRLQYSITDIGGGILAVPNFTLYADCSRGRRPDFTRALAPQRAQPLFERFVQLLEDAGIAQVASGRFGANMQVELVNDGPVSLLLESGE
jgi:D-tyrosyl-tRNA(Tyr) deacylase